jgi:hypothetical protein
MATGDRGTGDGVYDFVQDRDSSASEEDGPISFPGVGRPRANRSFQTNHNDPTAAQPSAMTSMSDSDCRSFMAAIAALTRSSASVVAHKRTRLTFLKW